jgi:hypothetical protein
MKTYSRNFIARCAGILLVSVFTFSSCKHHEETAGEKTLALLNSTWHCTRVTIDGVNRNDLFPGFVLTFAPGVYSSVNGGPVWPVAGTWSFTNSAANAITRNDGLVATITSLTNANLTLSLQWSKTTFGGGRMHSIQGAHVFEFSK